MDQRGRVIVMHAYVRDVMTAPAVAVRPDTAYQQLAAMFRRYRVSGFPVLDEGRVIGVVSETDLLALAAGGDDSAPSHPARRGWRPHRSQHAPGQVAAGNLMTHPAVTVSPDDLVQTAARLMQARGLQRLPVVDGNGRLAGIVTRSDVLSVFRQSDEEIRREVTEDVIADGVFTDPARFTVTVHNGIVTLEGAPGSTVLGASIVAQVGHLEGVVAVRDRFTYPAPALPNRIGQGG